MTQPARRTFLPGHVVVIICSITIQLANVARTVNLERYQWSYYKIVTFSYLGLLFLSYPLLGYIADVCLTRYRTLQCSFIFLIVAYPIGLLFCIIYITVRLTNIFIYSEMLIVGTTITGILVTTGVGLFEANVLQFGLDQLLEAPTLKLIAFIHWYYWTQNVVQLLVKYLTVGLLVIGISFPRHTEQGILYTSVFTAVAILGLAAIGSLVLLHKSKRHLYILRAGLNPFKNIYKMLKYSWILGTTRSLSIAVPSPTGKRIFHIVLTWAKTNMEDHLPMRRWRTLRYSYASCLFSCVCLDTI